MGRAQTEQVATIKYNKKKMPLVRLKRKPQTITEDPFCAKNSVWH